MSKSYEKNSELVAYWVNSIDKIKKACEEYSIRFAFVIAPEKNVVCHSDLPDDYHLSLSRLALRIEELYPDTVIYPLPSTKHIDSDVIQYHRLDSHWTFPFGQRVFQDLIKILYNVDNIETGFTVDEHVPDLLQHFQNTKRSTLERFVDLSNVDVKVVNSVEGRQSDLHLTSLNKSPTFESDTAIVIGDSYSWNPDAGLFRFFSQHFRATDFYWSSNVDFAINFVTERLPNVFVFEIAERFLYFPK